MAERAGPDLLPGTLHIMILHVLRNGSLHGYAIAKRIKDSSRGDLVVEEGSLYPALNRLLLKGWLESEWGLSDNSRKARFYRLTSAGRKRLQQETGEFKRLIRAIGLVLEST